MDEQKEKYWKYEEMLFKKLIENKVINNGIIFILNKYYIREKS